MEVMVVRGNWSGPAALALLLGACGARTESTLKPVPRPHIFLISIDTLRQDHVGVYGYERDTTPVLDELAQSSLVFERAYTTASYTLIAHMSMLTGLYPRQHGVLTPRNVLPDEVPTLAERLREAGYYTMGFHFPGWLDPSYGFGRGYDHYEAHRTAEIAEEHLFAALDKAPKDKPLFCFVHLFDVHNASLARQQKALYEPPPPFDRWFVKDAHERIDGLTARLIWKNDGSTVSPSQHEAIIGMYDGGIRYVDTKLGEWIEALRGRGLFEDSLFVVTSDHGEGLHQRTATYSGHGGVFEEGLLVPFLVRYPGGHLGGKRVSEPVSHVDLLPTLMSMLGLSLDDRLPGFSLQDGRPKGAPLFAERPGIDAMIQWPWKIVRRDGGGRNYLYNLEADPLESTNLILGKLRAQNTQRFESLLELSAQSVGQRYQPEQTSPQTDDRSEETRQLLRDLGYADDSD